MHNVQPPQERKKEKRTLKYDSPLIVVHLKFRNEKAPTQTSHLAPQKANSSDMKHSINIKQISVSTS